MTHNGLLIAIEGKNESESKTQLDLLTRNLDKNGYKFLSINFPKSNEPSSYFINQLENDAFGDRENIGPYTSSIFYAIDRYSSLKSINEALDRNQIVIVSNFTMSTAAKEGSVFNDISDFNDYLMWLKAVENKMLGLPEPDISIVLDSRSELDEKSNLIKRNFDHIISIAPDKSREVSNTRDGKILSEQEIENIIFEIVKPLLPERNDNTLKDENNYSGNESSHNDDQIVIKNISNYLIAQIQTFSSSPKIKIESSDLKFYSPDFNNEHSKEKYIDFNKKILKIYNNIHKKMIESNLSDQETEMLLDNILPVSKLSDISISNDPTSIINLALVLNKINNPESEKVLKKLLTKFDIKMPKINPKSKAESKLNDLVSNGYGSSHEPKVSLVNTFPRNEFDLIAEFLYPTAVMPYRQIKSEIDNWTYDNKSSILRLYLNGHLNDCNDSDCQLDNIFYNLEIIISQKIINEITNKKLFKKINHQSISPRLGYKIPTQFKNLDIDEYIEECFDLSLEIYSELQAINESSALEYCCLLGNNTRSKIIINIHQLIKLNKYLEAVGENSLSYNIKEQISLNHPIISESLN